MALLDFAKKLKDDLLDKTTLDERIGNALQKRQMVSPLPKDMQMKSNRGLKTFAKSLAGSVAPTASFIGSEIYRRNKPAVDKGINRMVSNVKADPWALSPLSMREQAVPLAGDNLLGRGLRGAFSLTAMQRPGSKLQASAPTTQKQINQEKLGRGAMGLALTAPLGGGSMLANAVSRGTIGAGIGGVIGGGINKLTGGNVRQGVQQGIVEGFSSAPLYAITNPLTDKVLKGVSTLASNPLARQGVKRGVGAIANVIEDEALALLDQYNLSNKDRVISALIGGALTANEDALRYVAREMDKAKLPKQVKQQVGAWVNQSRNKLGQFAGKLEESIKGKYMDEVLKETPEKTFKKVGPRKYVVADDTSAAFGAFFGFEFETDEEGRITGVSGFNPQMAALGVAGMTAGKKFDIKPKTNLLDQARQLRELGTEQLGANRVEAEMAKQVRSLFSDDIIESINKIKRSVRKDNFTGDVETLRKSKIGDDVNKVVEAVQEARPDIIGDDAALDFAFSFPTKAETVTKTPEAIKTARELERKARQVYDKVYNAQATPETISKTIKKNEEALKKTARQEFEQWQKAVIEQSGGKRTTSEAIDIIAKNIQQNTDATNIDVKGLKDIGNVSKGWNTVYRNFKKVYGDKFPQIKQKLLDPFDQSKGQYIDELNKWSDELDRNIVQGLGITKGSKESADVQLFGERKKSYEMLVQDHGKETADKIVAADQWFRQQYDNLIDQVNRVRAQVYPGNPDKQIPKRKDYYRHFREMQEGFGALVNIFDQPHKIAPGLESISEGTKPKSKWLSFAQKRLGEKTDIDAVGGFIDYIRSASYAKNIDPHIQSFRNLREELVNATGNVESAEYGQVNNFINFLDKYANDLSGKTNQADRIFQEYVPGGRQAFAAINWLNNRVKANTILANLSSGLAQFFNIPQAVASAGKHSKAGLGDTLASIFKKDMPINESVFIKERYDDPFSKFDTGLINDAKKFAGWIISVGDEIGTKFSWNAHYRKALAEGIENPVKYADDMTRDLVGGRGIGEVPLLQKAKVTQLVAPFQLEVANLWYVLGDFVSKKEFQKLATFSVGMYLMNRGAESIRGSDVGFDPLNAMLDSLDIAREEEGENKGLRIAGRLSGEVLSNLPIGQTAAAMYPESGFSIGDNKMPTREEFFGDADPTRFGGGLLAMKALQDPLYKVLPPFGGQQIKRTIDGISSYSKGASETKSGRVRFPIDKTPGNFAKSALFGQYSTSNARSYFDNDKKPLGDNQSNLFRQAQNPIEASEYYKAIMDRRSDNQQPVIKLASKELPDNEEDLQTLYDEAKRTVKGFQEKRVKIQYDQDLTELEKRDDLNKLQQEVDSATQRIKLIQEKKPQAVLKLELKQNSSDGSAKVADRAIWAADKLQNAEGKEREKLLKQMYDNNVLTKSVVEEINKTYGLGLTKYNYGGKIKTLSGSGGRKVSIKKSSPYKISLGGGRASTPQLRAPSVNIRPTQLPSFKLRANKPQSLSLKAIYQPKQIKGKTIRIST